MSDQEQLVAMGFDPERAALGLKASGNLQGALDLIEKHQDRPLDEIKAEQASAAEEPPELKPGEEAKSLVCEDCGKKFRSVAQAEFHGSKTGHENFAESTEEIAPLTEEEKKQRLEELRQKLAAKQGYLPARDGIEGPAGFPARSTIKLMPLDAAKALFKMAGQDFDALKKQAVSRDFKPVALGLQASMGIRNTMRTIDSQNVVAKVEGSDPRLRDEYVVYSAHWDHLGVNASGDGDRINNGALDNASGVAAMPMGSAATGTAQRVSRVSLAEARGSRIWTRFLSRRVTATRPSARTSCRAAATGAADRADPTAARTGRRRASTRR